MNPDILTGIIFVGIAAGVLTAGQILLSRFKKRLKE